MYKARLKNIENQKRKCQEEKIRVEQGPQRGRSAEKACRGQFEDHLRAALSKKRRLETVIMKRV